MATTDDNGKGRRAAARLARRIGCSGAHQGPNGEWMPCGSHEELQRLSNAAESRLPSGLKSADEPPPCIGCAQEYKSARSRQGDKHRKRWSKFRERGIAGIATLPDGGLVSEPIVTAKAGAASTPAPEKDRIFGSDRNDEGSASSGRNDIEIDDATETALRDKVRTHNEGMDESDKPAWSRTSLGTLKAVYRRGAGAFSTSHRPGMTRNQWAMGRVNAYLRILSSGKPENRNYITDNDLLPEGHPWRERRDEKQRFDYFARDGDLDGLIQDGTPQQRRSRTLSHATIGRRKKKPVNRVRLRDLPFPYPSEPTPDLDEPAT